MADYDQQAWNEARKVLGMADELPRSPRLLPYEVRAKLARALAQEPYWRQQDTADAYGVSQPAVSNMLRGVEPWREVAGRGPSTTPGRPAVVRDVEPRLVDTIPEGDQPNIEPGEPWWYDDEVDDSEPDDEPAPRPTSRAKAKPKGLYGWTTPMVVAKLRREGHEVDDNGRVTRWANSAATAPQEPATAAPATLAPVPPPPSLRPPVVAPQRPSASSAGTVAVELECGHVERDLPLNGPWVQRRWVACSRCGLAHRSIRRPLR